MFVFKDILVHFQNRCQVLLPGKAGGEVTARTRELSRHLGAGVTLSSMDREGQILICL